MLINQKRERKKISHISKVITLFKREETKYADY